LTTTRRSRQNPAIRDYILRSVEAFPGSIARKASEEFGLSRTAVNRYLRRLIDEGLLIATGKTNARRYELRNLVDISFQLEGITASLSEDTVWRFRILPNIRDVPRNVVDICQYGFTEMLNNVIDHSVSDDAVISYRQNYCGISMLIKDSGVGIFEKIQKDFNLPDRRSALLELSKGKLTSDKARHTGEGIFFASRMFDTFEIASGKLLYTRSRTDDDEWLVETDDIIDGGSGTAVRMKISTDARWTTREIFAQYEGDHTRFRKTHVPIKLGNYPGEQLVSRSQAKRVLARFEEFSEVLLDFQGVAEIGQAFADEIFRVFRNAHPDITIISARAEPNVQNTIDRAMPSSDDGEQGTLFP
jgi:anti-sigma regulatory factor (Ser/Thr protein kinase)